MRYKNKLQTFLAWLHQAFSITYIKTSVQNSMVKIRSELKKGSIRNILCFSGLAKILFLYFIVVLCIIITSFDFSSNILSKNLKHKVAIYSVQDRIGEHRSYVRTLKALDKMGWGYVGASFDENMTSDPWTSHVYKVAANIINMMVRPEFNLALTHYVKIVPYGYNITYFNMPEASFYTLQHKFKSEFQHLEKYDAYADLASVMDAPNPLLRSVLKNHDKQNALIIPAYLAQDFEELILPDDYKTAVITGTLWGCNRGSFRFKDAIQMLANEKLLVAYGLPEYFDYLGSGYLGRMEDYGDAGEQLILQQRRGGIALIVHNFEHLVQGLPTSRFAEGIMSGAVVISDKHPFLQKYFGDNVLYFDSFASSEEIHKQIKNHIEWVFAHPDEARKMSKNAYDIFVKDWTLEVQLQRIMSIVK